MVKKFPSQSPFLILILYLLPIFVWSGISLHYMPLQPSWLILSTGLCLAFFGALAMFILIQPQEMEAVEAPVEALAPMLPEKKEEEPDSSEYALLSAELDFYKQEIEQLKKQVEALKSENIHEQALYQTTVSAKENENKRLSKELEEKIKDSQKKEEEIASANQKIIELEYEIKTLVDSSLEEIEPQDDYQILSEEKAYAVLKKWIDNLTSTQNEPLDKGVFLEKFIETEKNAALFVLSIDDERVLFSNHYAGSLFFASKEEFPEKFSLKFPKNSLEWHLMKEKLFQNKMASLTSDGMKIIIGKPLNGPYKDLAIGTAF